MRLFQSLIVLAPLVLAQVEERVDGFQCSDTINGNHADPAASCSTNFTTCNYGTKWWHQCPERLYYDGFTGLCKYKREVPACCGNDRFLPRFTKEYFNCDERHDGYYADQFYVCAAHFFVCSNDVGWLKYCPRGSVFHPRLKICTDPNGIEHCSVPTCRK